MAVTQRNRIAPLLKNEKVKIVACETSMEARNITKEELAPGVIYVPASLKEIINSSYGNLREVIPRSRY